MAENDRKEKSKLVLAERLRTLQAAGFLDFKDIVRHLGGHLSPGIAKLSMLVGFDKIYGDLFDHLVFEGNTKKVILDTWKRALLSEVSFIEELLQHIPGDEIPRLFEFWLTKTQERVTWEQLVNVFPYSVLRACAAEGDKRADEAVEDAPEAEVVEEVMEVEPSADTDAPPATGQPTGK